jgi:hypothetical protein
LKRSLKAQGKQAEQQVSFILRNLGSEYRVFDDVTLKTPKGTTQIDHVVISPYGIFVIETKSHKGTIIGSEDYKYWLQILRGSRYSFYSPFLQNYAHLKTLYKLFNLNYKYFLGLICFTSDSVNLYKCTCSRVVHISNLAQVIANYKTILLSSNDIERLSYLLKTNSYNSKYMEQKHIKYVKSLQRKR